MFSRRLFPFFSFPLSSCTGLSIRSLFTRVGLRSMYSTSRTLLMTGMHSVFLFQRRVSNSLESVQNHGSEQPEGVTCVTDVETARRVVKKLMQVPNTVYHALDTEVINLDLSVDSPVGHGKCICFSIFCGPTFDFGNGPRIWVDTNDEHKAKDIWEAFRPYLESKNIKKVWHNYGFDRHIFNNEGIDVSGFGGDTMHMARLWNSARFSGYSLETLSSELLSKPKRSMKELFGRHVTLKNGTEGKKIELPPLEILQTDPITRNGWIGYSTYDAEATWLLHAALTKFLKKMSWNQEKNMFDFYITYWVPFGDLLTGIAFFVFIFKLEMERNGFHVNANHIETIAELAVVERDKSEAEFLKWVAKVRPESVKMNVSRFVS